MKTCPSCGAQIDDSSLFCTECGKQIPQGNVCSHCGAPVNNGDSFCQNCGNKIDEQPTSTSPIPEQDVTDIELQNQELYEEEDDSQNKLLKPLIALLILALIGGGWWYYKSSGNSTNGNALQEVADSISSGTDEDKAEEDKVYSEKDIQEMKEFLEQFYGEMDSMGEFEESHVKKNVTAKALKTLEKYGNEYLSCDEFSGGQLSGCKIEHIEANLFEVCVITYMGMGVFPEYKVKLSVVKKDGSYKIDTIEKIGSEISEGELTEKWDDANLDWLQGHWVYEQGSYKGHFIIQGDKIIQYSSMNPEHYEATFRIEDGEIRARLAGGMDLAVKIDFTNQRIDYGDGCWMHKVSSSSSDYSSPSSNTSSSKTFANEQYVTMYLANQTFRSNDGLAIRVDGNLRMYIDGDYAGVVSVLRFNSTSALLRYGGGAYGDGRITVQIVGDKLQLIDPEDGSVYHQN